VRGTRRALLALGVGLFAASSSGQTGGEPSAGPALLAVAPDTVRVGLFFNGALLHVQGSIPAGYQAAVLCTGKEGRLDLKKKGRVWGLFWMNTGDVVFDHVPSVYLLCTSAPLKELAPAAVLTRLGVGAEALEGRATAGNRTLFGELVRLKEDEKLWSVVESTLSLKPGADGRLEAAADLFLPPRIPPGEYRIRLLSFRDGEGADAAETAVSVRQEGLAAFTSRMAHERGLLY
jgi:Putative transmembrane protein (Alph_Pro_TM)